MAAKRRTKENTEKPIVICICGMAGSGKSTVAKKLAKKYRLNYCSGGDALKALALEEEYKAIERGWWESKEGISFLEKRSRDPKFDEIIDKKLLELARQGNVVLDSWTMPWLFKEGFNIWLEASLKKRAQRTAKRNRISLSEASEALKIKGKQTKAIYKKLYGFKLAEDFTPFHFILDTDNLTADEVFQTLCAVIENIVL